MKDPSYAIQGAVYTKLAAAAGVKALIGDPARIYDKVVADPTYPFVRIGDDQVLDNSNTCADGWEAVVTLHIFSRNPTAPRPEVKAISNAIGIAIGNDDSLIAPAGFEVTEVRFGQSHTFMEADGVTAHGVMTLRYLVNDA